MVAAGDGSAISKPGDDPKPHEHNATAFTRRDTPLCPAGHLPLKGGDRPGATAPRCGGRRREIDQGACAHAAGGEVRDSRWVPCGPPHPPISPLEGEMSAQPTEGGLRWWRQGMAARFPSQATTPSRTKHNATAFTRRDRRAPPSVLPDISPSRGEIGLGQPPGDAAGGGARAARGARADGYQMPMAS